MKNLKSFVLICAFSLIFALPSQAQENNVAPNNAPHSFADLVEELLPAVVNISSTQKIEQQQNMPFPDFPQFPEGSPFNDFFQEFQDRHERLMPRMPSIPASSLGSGFIIDAEEKLIITNNHVIRDADEVRVTFHDDETVQAEVIGRDEKTDIAVLRVETDKELKAVGFGESDDVRVGDWVVAIGNPFGLGGTVTAGIVSARQRDINSGPYDDYIQTDASINRGNSGGPMFDLDGNVIGINTAIFSPTGGSVGIGFAIPSSLAQPVIRQIVEYGRTRRGWLGVRIQSVTEEIAESLELEEVRGALVASVTEDSPAAAAGLQAGDVILTLNGEEIEEMRQLPRLVAETPIDSDAQVTYWRDGREGSTSVQIGELEKAEEDGLIETAETDLDEIDQTPPKSYEALGMGLAPVTDQTRNEYGLSDHDTGMVITNVEVGSEAERKGMMVSDVIVEINQRSLNSAEDIEDILEDARSVGRSSVLLLVSRDGNVSFVALKLDDDTE